MAGALALARPRAPAAEGRVPVVTESGLASQVGRGENAGRLLRHAAVVRQPRTEAARRLETLQPARRGFGAGNSCAPNCGDCLYFNEE